MVELEVVEVVVVVKVVEVVVEGVGVGVDRSVIVVPQGDVLKPSI